MPFSLICSSLIFMIPIVTERYTNHSEEGTKTLCTDNTRLAEAWQFIPLVKIIETGNSRREIPWTLDQLRTQEVLEQYTREVERLVASATAALNVVRLLCCKWLSIAQLGFI